MAGQAEWESFKIQLPGKDFLEPVRNVLETLLVFLEVLKAILETVKAFLIDFPNPLTALIKALIALVNTFFEAINRTGLYAWYDVPDPTVDPHYFRFQGGYPAFVNRFKAGLIDPKDPNRPQPISGATQSGFVVIVCDAQGPIELIRLIKILLRFFRKDLLHPKYPPPSNLKVLPFGSNRDPILNLQRLFEADLQGVMLSWTLGGQISSPDPGFRDLGNAVASEFNPPNWIIERSELPITTPLDSGQITAPNVAGYLTASVDTDHEIRGAPNKRAKQVIRVLDEAGDPVIRFQKVIPVTTGSGAADAIIGELGVFKWFDTDVKFDTTYLYRVRAYSGDLPISNGIIQYAMGKDPHNGRPIATLPTGVVMGLPSAVFRVRVAQPPKDFNVLTQLTNLFLTAFSLNFHLELPPGSKFDDQDNPQPPSDAADIGLGSLVTSAGILAPLQADPFLGQLTGGTGRLTSAFKQPTNPLNDQPEPPFWGQTAVQHQAKRLAGIVGSALLEQGSGAIGQFQTIMTGAYPREAPRAQGTIASATNLSELCSALTFLDSDGRTNNDTYSTWGEAFSDAGVRKNVLFAVRFVKSFTLGGTPPDWIQVSILRDIIPWSGQLLYDILAKIQALLDAFKSVLDEIKNFIDMLERKIEVLERFIQFLLSILDFILNLQAGFFILKLPSTDGDVFSWMEAIDTASGTKPSSGPGGYSCGVAFAYIAVNVEAFATAFDLIF